MNKYILDDVCFIQSGGTPKRSEDSYYDSNYIPWVKVGDLNNGTLMITEEYISQKGLESIGNRTFPKGCLLLAMYGSVGKTSIAGREVSANQAVLGIDSKDKNLLINPYLKYWFNFNIDELKFRSKGGVLKNLNAGFVKNIKIPIPPLKTQRKIVEIFRKLNSLILNRLRSIGLLNEYLFSYFLELTGDPILNKHGFSVKKINELKLDTRNSIKAGPFGSALKKSFYVSEGYKIYGQEQVVKGIDYGDYYITEDKYNELLSCKVEPGDVLISLMGVVGKTAIIPNEFEEGVINPRLMKISFDQKKILPLFFSYMFESPPIQSKVLHSSRGIAMKGLNLGIVKNIEVVVPPLEIQNKFVEKKKKVDYQKLQYKKSKKFLDELFQSFIYQVFNPQRGLRLKDEVSELLDDNIQLELFLNTLNASDFQSVDQYNIEVEKLFKVLKKTGLEIKGNEGLRKGIIQLKNGKKIELVAKKDYLNKIINETKES